MHCLLAAVSKLEHLRDPPQHGQKAAGRGLRQGLHVKIEQLHPRLGRWVGGGKVHSFHQAASDVLRINQTYI